MTNEKSSTQENDLLPIAKASAQLEESILDLINSNPLFKSFSEMIKHDLESLFRTLGGLTATEAAAVRDLERLKSGERLKKILKGITLNEETH